MHESVLFSEMQDHARAVLRNSLTWLSSRTTNDPHGAALLLFGMGCALGAMDAMDRSENCLSAIRLLAEKLNHSWSAERSSMTKETWEKSFVTAMMGAAAFRAVEKTSALGETLVAIWRISEANGWLQHNPTLLWTGRRLAHLIVPEAHDEFYGACWKPQFSALFAPYTIDAASIRQLCADVAAMTAYGQVNPRLPPLDKKRLEEALRLWLFCYLKDQDLDMVCPVLRALQYLGLSSTLEFEEAVAFVLQRSCADGRFAMRKAALHLYSSEGQLNHEVSRLIYLPLTVASIWALVECIFSSQTPFRLRSNG
jgi:hypothetical protein